MRNAKKLSISYRVFVWLLDHWLKVFVGWVCLAAFGGVIFQEPGWITRAAVFPVLALAAVAAVMIVWGVLVKLIGRLLP